MIKAGFINAQSEHNKVEANFYLTYDSVVYTFSAFLRYG